jgi:hypothetical protein
MQKPEGVTKESKERKARLTGRREPKRRGQGRGWEVGKRQGWEGQADRQAATELANLCMVKVGNLYNRND